MTTIGPGENPGDRSIENPKIENSLGERLTSILKQNLPVDEFNEISRSYTRNATDTGNSSENVDYDSKETIEGLFASAKKEMQDLKTPLPNENQNITYG